jgi:IS30 family transposase
MAEREEISGAVAAATPAGRIAKRLGRAPSTVSQELARNGGRGCYQAQAADATVLRRAQRPKAAKLAVESRLRTVVEAKLALRWSPQQIAGWLTAGSRPLASPKPCHAAYSSGGASPRPGGGDRGTHPAQRQPG